MNQLKNKPKQLFKVLFFMSCFQIIVKAVDAQAVRLNLKEAIELALQSNRTLRSDSLGIMQTAYRNKELAGSFLPQVNYVNGIESNLAIAKQMVPGSMVNQPSKEFVPVQFGTRYGVKTGVEVNQTIYRKDLSVKVKAADLYTDIAKSKYNLSKEELVYQVAASFFSLQSSFEMVQSTLHDYTNISEVLKVAKAQFENGILKKIDYQTLQINLANKQSQLDQYRTRYSEQVSYLNYLLGLPATTETVTYGDYSSASKLNAPGDNTSNRIDVQMYQQMIQSKLVDLKSTHAEKLPTINSYFRFNVQSQFNKASAAFDGDYRYKASSIGISLSMPIFDGNRRRYRAKATAIELEQLKLQSFQLKDQAAMELVKTSKTFQNNKQQLTITKENLELAQKVFDSRRALYTEGVTTLIELLDAERELSQARTNYTQAVIEVQKGWMDVHKVNGTLLTAFVNSL